MEDHCKFIWQLIEETPALRQSLQKLDSEEYQNNDKKVGDYIDFFRDVELMIEELRNGFDFNPQPVGAKQRPRFIGATRRSEAEIPIYRDNIQL